MSKREGHKFKSAGAWGRGRRVKERVGGAKFANNTNATNNDNRKNMKC